MRRKSLVGGGAGSDNRPRNLLRIYLVPFCVGYSTRSPSWNQMLLSRVCFSIHLWRLLFDPLVDCVCGLRFFLDRSWTGNANEQPISPPADGRHVPLGRGRCKHYRNIGRSCAVIIGSRFLDKGQAAGLHQQSNENEPFSENLSSCMRCSSLSADSRNSAANSSSAVFA